MRKPRGGFESRSMALIISPINKKNCKLRNEVHEPKMSDWVVGYIMGMAAGIVAGFAIGFAAGKKQKPWSELTEQEKKLRKFLIGAGVALLVLGVMVFALFEFGL